MILLPTKGRPHNLERYLNACIDTHSTERHIIILEDDDSEISGYQKLINHLPFSWIVSSYKNGKGAASHFNKVFEEFPNEKFYGIVGDDVVPSTLYWDRELKDACLSNHFSWPDDGERHEAFAPFSFMSGKLVRAVGTLNPLGVDHYGFDNFWFNLGTFVGGKYCHHVLLEHMHPRVGKAPMDSTYKHDAVKRIPDQNPDSDKWRSYKKSKEFDELKLKIRGILNA